LENPEVPYLNSAKYTDYYLGKYFEQAKKEGWYENTLFILISDHSHRTYNQWDYHSAEYQHIPMLWLGGALKNEFRGKQIDKLCSQIDIPYTILRQIDINSDSYKWSNDILNPNSGQFVPVETTVGLNWIRPNGFIFYDGFKNESKVSGFENDSVRNQEILFNKAFLQYLYETYLNY
jgi:phosphoglycerol transferase MdoB-like AlkP superfamily enzyme